MNNYIPENTMDVIIYPGSYLISYRQVSNIMRRCRRCFNYIFILDLTPGFKGLDKDDRKTRGESFKFWDLVRLILETLR